MARLFRNFASVTLITVVVLSACILASDENKPELKQAFPNYAMVLQPAAGSRVNPVGAPDTEEPFGWDQYVVLREGETNIRRIFAFDPDLQPVLIHLLPYEPVNVKVTSFDGDSGFLVLQARAKTGGLTETFLYQVQSRGILNTDIHNVVYDIRDENSRVRGTPFLTMSPGDFVKPGQIVRYAWTQTGRGEKRPKCEAEFSGRTGAAKGITSSTITSVLATKVQPFVLGHYLMTVTPRDVRGEPPRGSTSNGMVFRCAFGSENLPPTTDGLKADTFLPAVNQSVTLEPFAIDPETGVSTFSNETWDFGDGTFAQGISGATTHAYALPGIYRARCTVADDQGLPATAEDNIIVGATVTPTLSFSFQKEIVPNEGGIGLIEEDKLSVTFKGIGAGPGDRIIFCYNRNRFGGASSSDGDTEVILKKGGGFTGSTAIAKNFSVQASQKSISITAGKAQFDRTGDPRFGRGELKGIFKNQRIAVCVIPADGSTPKAMVYTGNVTVKVIGGDFNRLNFIPEEQIKGSATTKEPNPKKQEVF